MNAVDRIRAALKTAPAGFMTQICKDLGIDPKKVMLVTDQQADEIIDRLAALGPAPKTPYSSTDCGDGGVYVRSGRI